MSGGLVFDPLLGWPLVAGFAALAILSVGGALARGLPGWPLRALAGIVLLAALANPAVRREEREPLSDIVFLVVDESASQRIADREEQTEAAISDIREELARFENVELRVVRMGDGEDNEGSLLMTALAEAMTQEPRARIAGAILLTDGRIHDPGLLPEMPAPLHALLTGRATDWDRRISVSDAPAYAILGEPVTLTLRIEDQGAAPERLGAETDLAISVDGGTPRTYRVPIGEDMELPLTLPHGGMNVIQFGVHEEDGELTGRNNRAVVQINGVRDRLRVLLVSGEPHSGERTWRNLLKSDSLVDLVHFTILRPPEKHDGVPVDELSLIAFPTRELFVEKVGEFDLIVFDRYKRRGILPSVYLENIRQYVVDGGAVLVAAGPDFATADSLYRSPLAEIMPAVPTSRVIEEGFHPEITEIGQRHPVTEGLEAFAPEAPSDEEPGWGRWFRQVEMEKRSGESLMSGIEGRPLLVLDRAGSGRVALLGSDHAWLWHRGYEGGGPQQELLRRLAHWMMKEPELEEEALTAAAEGRTMTITRRTLGEEVGDLEITRPDGIVDYLRMNEIGPGRYETAYEGPLLGLYRLKEGDEETVIALGPASPREFEEVIASGEILRPATNSYRGGVKPLDDGAPRIRQVREGRAAHGRGWIGIVPRDAYLTSEITIFPLSLPWLFLMLAALFIAAAWLREGRS